jgi:hypothetical protein
MDTKKVLGTVGGVVVVVVALATASCGVRGSVENQIKEMATQLNKGLPKQVDAVTRWDRVDPGPGRQFAYIYTISAPLSDQDKRTVQSTVTQKALSEPAMKTFFDNGVTIWYKYYDSKGKKMLEFSVKR